MPETVDPVCVDSRGRRGYMVCLQTVCRVRSRKSSVIANWAARVVCA
jgi:hypothetical protein